SGGKLLGAGERRAGETAPVSSQPASGAAAKPVAAGTKSIDGILVRGLYLYNPKQQEIVVDYLRNLASSPFFVVDPKIPERLIKSTPAPNGRQWPNHPEARLTLRKQ